MIRVNGYDNRFIGWGEEDQNLARRLLRAGVNERHLRYGAVCWHLWHASQQRINERREDAIEEVVCPFGLNKLTELKPVER